jgi:hypothetical protein
LGNLTVFANARTNKQTRKIRFENFKEDDSIIILAGCAYTVRTTYSANYSPNPISEQIIVYESNAAMPADTQNIETINIGYSRLSIYFN